MKKQIILISVLSLFSLFLISNIATVLAEDNMTDVQIIQAQISNLTSEINSLSNNIIILQQQINNITLMPGPKGDKGDKGDQGVPGINGTNGIDGVNGTNGVNGSQGLQGEQGPQGISGSQGGLGINGVNGSRGPKGEKGDQGIAGMNGLNGLNGIKGDKGDQGIPGINGINGTDGINGINGINGTNGIDGTNATVDLTPIENRLSALENFKNAILTFFKNTFGVWFGLNGQYKCVGNIQQEYINNTWTNNQTCQYGCIDGTCNNAPSTKEDCTQKKVGISCSANNDKYKIFVGCQKGHGTSTSCDNGFCISSGILSATCPNGCNTVTNLCK